MNQPILIRDFIANPPDALADLAPWAATQRGNELVGQFVAAAGLDFIKSDGMAIHKSTVIEKGAVLKGPIYIGPNCMVAAGAYLRGGVWLEGDDIIGPACEVKTTFMFSNSKIAHLSFVGDSVLGHDVNVEAGAMIANYRNEKLDKRIRFLFKGQMIDTGVMKFGAMIGDHTRIGANAVVAPGAVLERGSIINRLQLVDQS